MEPSAQQAECETAGGCEGGGGTIFVQTKFISALHKLVQVCVICVCDSRGQARSAGG